MLKYMGVDLVIKMKKWASLLITLIVLVSMGSGCGGGNKEQTVRFILPDAIDSLDPQIAKSEGEKIVMRHLFEGLCRLDETGQTIPGAAKKWESNENNTVFTFTLRKNICWNDGTPLTAHDFLYGLQRALDPETKASGLEDLYIIKNATGINKGLLSMSSLGVEVPSDDVIIFTLENSYEQFPYLTTGSRFMPCNETFFLGTQGKYGIDCENTLTNGPFNWENIYSWEKDQSKGAYFNVGRASRYNGSNVGVPDRIEFLMGESHYLPDGAVAGLQEGVVDVQRVQGSEVDVAKEAECSVVPLNDAVCGLLLNTEDELLKYQDIREVLICTIDRQSLMPRLPEGTQEANGIVPKCVMWNQQTYRDLSDSMYATSNPEIANRVPELMKLYEIDGTAMPSITVICPDDEDSKAMVNGIIVSWNKYLKNAFNIEPLPLAEFERRIRAKSYQAALYSLSAGGTTPNTVFSKFSSTASPRLLDSQEFDEYLGGMTFSMESYKEMETYLIDQFVFYPIHYSYRYFAVAQGVSDVVITPNVGVDLRLVKKK